MGHCKIILLMVTAIIYYEIKLGYSMENPAGFKCISGTGRYEGINEVEQHAIHKLKYAHKVKFMEQIIVTYRIKKS